MDNVGSLETRTCRHLPSRERRESAIKTLPPAGGFGMSSNRIPVGAIPGQRTPDLRCKEVKLGSLKDFSVRRALHWAP